MNNSSPLKKNGLFTSPILGLYDKPRQLIVEYYLHWTITFDIFFQQVQTQITTAYCRIPTLDPVVAPKGAGGLKPSCRGVLAPPLARRGKFIHLSGKTDKNLAYRA